MEQGILRDEDIRTTSIFGFDPIAKKKQISQFFDVPNIQYSYTL